MPQFLSLLGKHLKDQEVIDLLDEHGIEVTYHFDRLNENTPDKFWAPSKRGGFQCGFTSDQVLSVVFLYITPRDGFSVIDPATIDVPVFDAIPAVEAHCVASGLSCAKGSATDSAGTRCEWARIDSAERSLHYEFRGGTLSLITLSLPRKKR